MLNEHELDPELIREFLQHSIREFSDRTWGASEQYLDVMEIATEGGIPVIARVDETEGDYAVYFKVNSEEFYYTHYFRINPIVELVGMEITPSSAIFLRVSSASIDLIDILSHTSLTPTRTWQKGQLRPPQKLSSFVYKESGFAFELDKNHAGNFEEKLLVLLRYLEAYDQQLRVLTEIGCDLLIDVYWAAYIGNSLVGGLNLAKEIIAKLNNLGLGFNFDIQVTGTAFK